MSDLQPHRGAFAAAIRYLSLLAGSACVLLALTCLVIACQVFIQTGLFAQSYAIVGLIAAMLGVLALRLARIWK